MHWHSKCRLQKIEIITAPELVEEELGSPSDDVTNAGRPGRWHKQPKKRQCSQQRTWFKSVSLPALWHPQHPFPFSRWLHLKTSVRSKMQHSQQDMCISCSSSFTEGFAKMLVKVCLIGLSCPLGMISRRIGAYTISFHNYCSYTANNTVWKTEISHKSCPPPFFFSEVLMPACQMKSVLISIDQMYAMTNMTNLASSSSRLRLPMAKLPGTTTHKRLSHKWEGEWTVNSTITNT